MVNFLKKMGIGIVIIIIAGLLIAAFGFFGWLFYTYTIVQIIFFTVLILGVAYSLGGAWMSGY